jgi:hypothetical protein
MGAEAACGGSFSNSTSSWCDDVGMQRIGSQAAHILISQQAFG